MLRRLRITEYDFFHKTTAFTHTMYFFKIRRIGFRRIRTEPRSEFQWCYCNLNAELTGNF